MKTAAVFAGLVGLASAHWGDIGSFLCPNTANNICNSQQHSGFDWGSLLVGEFSAYADFSFSGFTCANSFFKRDELSKRNFQSKCVTGKLGHGSGPSISCGSKSSGFSITEYQISVSVAVEVEFLYAMEDGSTCRHTSPCQAGGSIIQNTQCGGAKSVSFQLPLGSLTSSCDLGIHNIIFDCSSSVNKPTTTALPASTKAASTTAVVASIPPVVTSVVASIPPVVTSVVTSIPPVVTSVVVSIPPVVTSVVVSIPPVVTSVVSVPVVSTLTTAITSIATSVVTTSVVATSLPYVPTPPGICPSVLPKCLNTWLHLTSCTDNSDYNCFCKQADFTAEVSTCLSAWGADSIEVQLAVTFFVGLCAEWVPVNPGIITNCPSTVTIGPTVSSTPAGPVQSQTQPIVVTSTTVVVATTVTTCPVGHTITGSAGSTTVLTAPHTSTVYLTSTSTIQQTTVAAVTATVIPVPLTTITVATTVTVPCTYASGVSAGLTISSSSHLTSISTVVTVPQVVLTTATAAGTSTGSVVSLGYGTPSGGPTPAPAPAKSTAAAVTISKSGFGTTYIPSATGGAPATFTGAAVLNRGSIGSIFVAGGLALFAL